MSEKIVQLNEEVIKGQLKELVGGSVEETLNELLEQEAEKLTQAARYERNEARQGYRSGHYDRNLTTTSGDVTLHVPRLKGVSFVHLNTSSDFLSTCIQSNFLSAPLYLREFMEAAFGRQFGRTKESASNTVLRVAPHWRLLEKNRSFLK